MCVYVCVYVCVCVCACVCLRLVHYFTVGQKSNGAKKSINNIFCFLLYFKSIIINESVSGWLTKKNTDTQNNYVNSLFSS